METWNREELYAEIWEKPAVKVAAKYGISSVMLGKVCRKLQIPRPGRGYWAKKEFGKPVEKILLPKVKDLPVMHRLKEFSYEEVPKPVQLPEPTDLEYQRILQVEATPVAIDPAKRHKLVSASEKLMKHATADSRGILQARWNDQCLDLRVSKSSVDRALNIMNMVILFLEAEKFVVTVKAERHGTVANVSGHEIPFSIVEKTREKGRKEVIEYSYKRTIIDYQPSGELEFCAGDDESSYPKIRDGKTHKLETLISKLAGAVLREGRDRVIRAENRRLREIEERKQAQERYALAEQIQEEEKKVKDLEGRVSNWAKAQEMREFIAALEKSWEKEGHDLSPEAPKGQRISWMKEQADRLDPLVVSPKSILDRKRKFNRWY